MDKANGIACCLCCALALALTGADGADIFFAGDSTLHSRRYLDTRPYPAEERCLGSWCDELEFFLKPGVRIVNPAFSGTSTKSFRDEGRWEGLIRQVKPGDFVYMQFGHNDQKKHDPKRYAAADGAYRDNLRRFAEEVRAKGGKPVFGTSLVRRYYESATSGRIADGLENYPDVVRALGREMGVPVVDFNAFSRRLVESAGRAESLKWYRAVLNKTDYTHLTRYGAKVMARAFYDEVKRGGYEIASLLRDDALPALQAFDAPFAFGAFSNWMPQFPNRDFRITDYGAKPDGSDATAAIAAAFDACVRAGGGRVVVPSGKWTAGNVRLRSNCDFHFEEGAVLDLPGESDRSPFVRGLCCTNVAITGLGVIAPCRTESLRNGAHTPLLEFDRCVNVLLDGFRIRESPFRTIRLCRSDNCTVRRLDSYAHGRNSDGIDVELTRDVLIENCRLDRADDGIFLAAGRNGDGCWQQHPTERVVVRNCRCGFSGPARFVGPELTGGVRDVWVQD